MIVKFVERGDPDYPLIPMVSVPNGERYNILKVDVGGKSTYFVPLFQVIDKIGIKPDAIIRNGVRVCPNCGAQMGVVE